MPPAAARTKKLVRREAAVFVMDTSPSMNRPFRGGAAPPCTAAAAAEAASSGDDVIPAALPSGSLATTKATFLEAAKHAVVRKLADLRASDKNEANVIVVGNHLATATTRRTIAADPNYAQHRRVRVNQNQEVMDSVLILQPGKLDLTPVEVPLLNRVKRLKAARSSPTVKEGGVDGEDGEAPLCSPPSLRRGSNLLHGLVRAGELLRSAHANREYQQGAAVYVLSDVRQTLTWPKGEMGRLAQLVDDLQALKCPVRFVWLEDELDDGNGASDSDCDDAGPAVNHRTLPNDEEEDSTDMEASSEDDDEDALYEWIIKSDKLKFLQEGIVEKTEGGVVFASSLRHVLSAVYSPRIPRATRMKMELEVVPNMVVKVHQSTLYVKKSLPTIKKDKVILVDEEGKPMVDESAQKPLTDKFYREVILADGDDVVEKDDLAMAVSYGNELVTMSDWDYIAIKSDDCYEIRLQVLGFIEESLVPQVYLKGPPKVFSGKGEGLESEAVVSALAQALHELKEVGICTVVAKTVASARHRPPILGALYPYRANAESSLPARLLFLQLPFSGEVKQMQFLHDYDAVVQEEDLDGSHARASDDLVASMMLPTDVLTSVATPNPAVRSWDQALVQTFLDPTTVVAALQCPFPMEPPQSTKEQAKSALDAFWNSFQLPSVQRKKKEEQDGKGKRMNGKLALCYKDFL